MISSQQKRRDAQFQGRAKAALEQANECALHYMGASEDAATVTTERMQVIFAQHFELTQEQARVASLAWPGHCLGRSSRPTREEFVVYINGCKE